MEEHINFEDRNEIRLTDLYEGCDASVVLMPCIETHLYRCLIKYEVSFLAFMISNRPTEFVIEFKQQIKELCGSCMKLSNKTK
jgi:hypothetical protein